MPGLTDETTKKDSEAPIEDLHGQNTVDEMHPAPTSVEQCLDSPAAAGFQRVALATLFLGMCTVWAAYRSPGHVCAP